MTLSEKEKPGAKEQVRTAVNEFVTDLTDHTCNSVRQIGSQYDDQQLHVLVSYAVIFNLYLFFIEVQKHTKSPHGLKEQADVALKQYINTSKNDPTFPHEHFTFIPESYQQTFKSNTINSFRAMWATLRRDISDTFILRECKSYAIKEKEPTTEAAKIIDRSIELQESRLKTDFNRAKSVAAEIHTQVLNYALAKGITQKAAWLERIYLTFGLYEQTARPEASINVEETAFMLFYRQRLCNPEQPGTLEALLKSLAIEKTQGATDVNDKALPRWLKPLRKALQLINEESTDFDPFTLILNMMTDKHARKVATSSNTTSAPIEPDQQ
ncbi:hypothetical protein C4579_02050 [Candidatus Microgenomates bacterium]|nr:MAG: hypothetical protein C4579_02050 [Candidatus Microgenomates bacterium]